VYENGLNSIGSVLLRDAGCSTGRLTVGEFEVSLCCAFWVIAVVEMVRRVTEVDSEVR